ncbi:1-phosphofructokinase [Aliagarivorans taiwanensis]|uniref:1-phosphofructokinase n=1 Tax=Aliagarivorans taiwanensis TaxID=561966 RepID=UPI0004289068|nr:1-phosphofructokinase [Aliagarivorans taiwanensis]
MTAQRILCVTLNPALDLTGTLEQLSRGSVNLVDYASLHAAGKGVNVAKVLAELGANVSVSGFLGLDNASAFEELFKQLEVEDHFIRVPGATRTNVKLVEASQQVTDVNFPGMPIDAQALQALEAKLLSLVDTHPWVVMAGSLPPGVSPAQFGQLVSKLKQAGAKVLVDSSREALTEALQAGPYMVKPNQEELEQWCGQPLENIAAIQAQGERLAALGIAHVVISRGEQGVLWLHQGNWYQAQPPLMQVVSTVGAGDTFVAGFCWGLSQGHVEAEQLRFATALSALAVSQVGVGVPPQHKLQATLDNTTFSKLSKTEG